MKLNHSAYSRLLADGPAREAVADALDCGQPRWRVGLPTKINWQAAIDLTQRCLDRRPDLPDDHREGLSQILLVLEAYPDSAFDEMVSLRRSFVAPVPGVMVERIRWREW